MDGSVDKNNELRSALCYFVDEAIGYRHSIHFFHRWLETRDHKELEGLVLEIGKEHFVDLTPILTSIRDISNLEGHRALQQFIDVNGLYSRATESHWPQKVEPMPRLDNSVAGYIEGNFWALNHWLTNNTINGENPFFLTAMAHSYIGEARSDFMKIFNLLEMMFGKDTTLFSCVLCNDIPLLGRMLAQYYPAQEVYINKLAETINANQTLNWLDALSRNQIKSKIWLIDKLADLKWYHKKRKVVDSDSNVLLVGGWVGLLPFLADMKNNYFDTVVNVDIDVSVHGASQNLNSVTGSEFKVSSKDVRTLPVKSYNNPLVIDTIVEHFENHGDWVKTLPPGTRVVLQGNDMFNVPDHVNCHKTLEEFVAACGLNNIVWAGELNLYKCTRFMAIGTV
jgi:hypothetical protein